MEDKSLEVIYEALLRAEKRYEARRDALGNSLGAAFEELAVGIVQTIREEIGNALAKASAP